LSSEVNDDTTQAAEVKPSDDATFRGPAAKATSSDDPPPLEVADLHFLPGDLLAGKFLDVSGR
jgi:hypothetical protein